MTDDFKWANLLPHLKKMTLDVEILKHFRPISNLPFVSKIVEKVVDNQTSDHMTRNNLHDIMQSAYKEYYSTETAMVRFHNDVLVGIDSGLSYLIVCIDMTAAFDTVNHQIMLQRLQQRLGITGTCLKWFQSYLSNRNQCVIINGTCSKPKVLSCGVPQGSVLGPKLYNIYTLPLGEIVEKHNVSRILFADDGNLYQAFRQNEIDPQKLTWNT